MQTLFTKTPEVQRQTTAMAVPGLSGAITATAIQEGKMAAAVLGQTSKCFASDITSMIDRSLCPESLAVCSARVF